MLLLHLAFLCIACVQAYREEGPDSPDCLLTSWVSARASCIPVLSITVEHWGDGLTLEPRLDSSHSPQPASQELGLQGRHAGLWFHVLEVTEDTGYLRTLESLKKL